MNKDYIYNLYFEYLIYFYLNPNKINELELDIDYRELSEQIISSKKKIINKINDFRSRKISQFHLSDELHNLNLRCQEYSAWGGLQIFYKNNINFFDKKINTIDFHGLYSHEAKAILKVFFPDYLNGTYKIITGNGSKVIYNLTLKFLKDNKIKNQIYNGYFIIKNCQ